MGKLGGGLYGWFLYETYAQIKNRPKQRYEAVG
jgi:hypothetical protein